MAFDQHLLAAFKAVAEHGTVGRAADALGSTQPTISRHIRALEDQLGHPLFDRDSRGMHLTAAGSDLLPRARLLLHEMAAAQELVDAHRGFAKGAVRIGGVTAVARAVFPAVVALMAKRAPTLRMEVTVASEDQLDRALANREIDIMFASAPPCEIEAVRIGAREFKDCCRVFCAPTHPILKVPDITVEMMLAQPWAMPPPGTTPRRQFEKVVREAGFAPPEIILQTESVDLILSVVARSDFLSWFPEPLLSEALRRGDVTLLPNSAFDLERRFAMYRRARGTFSVGAQMFVDSIGQLDR
ncbi:LysR family transcriptional regulator [soil metagenome]